MPSGPGRGRLRQIKVAGGKRAWQGEWSDARGRRRRIVLGDTKAAAERVLSAIIRDRDLELAGMGIERGLSMSVQEIAAQYIAALRTRSKPSARTKALDMARRTFDQLASHVRPRTVRDLTKPAMLSWRNALVAAGAANKTANSKVALVSAALNLAKEMGQLQANPLAGLKGLPTGPSHQRRRPRALSDWEVARVLAAAGEKDRERPDLFPWAPLVRAFILTGARLGEMLQLTWRDLDVSTGTLNFRAETTKNGKPKTIPLVAAELEGLLLLAEHARRVTGSAPASGARIFLLRTGRPFNAARADTFREWLMDCYGRAGILARGPGGKLSRKDANGFHLGCHTLRHSFGTRILRSGAPLPAAVKLMGHSNAKTLLATYAHFGDSDSRIAIEGLPALPSVGILPVASDEQAEAPARPAREG